MEAFTERRRRACGAGPDVLWSVVESIGGANGWYSPAVAWRLRTAVDARLGGVGMGSARRDPERLLAGETVDFWLVEDVYRPHRLALRALTRMPGTARMTFRVSAARIGSELEQQVEFRPHGVVGAAYWYAELPAHRWIFSQMVIRIVDEAERRAGS